LQDGREFEAVDVKTDPKSDLAVVRIDANNLPFAKMGNSDQLFVGDWVLALGQPFGLEGTVTAGIISAKGRGLGITDRENFLQTDAAINPGNSGGPLVNLNGEIIGINTAIHSRSGGNNGIGFAVPINMARWVSDQLVKNGEVSRAYLGVGIQKLSPDLAAQFSVQPGNGVVVTQIQQNSPAEKAGLQVGDIITHFDNQPITSPRQLQLSVEKSQAGRKQMIAIVRDGKSLQVAANCQDQENVVVARQSTPTHSVNNKLGVETQTLRQEIAAQLGLRVRRGVVITAIAPNSLASRLGMRAGMVISEINRIPVNSPEKLQELLNDNDNLMLLIHTQQGARFLVIES
jgi:serine protease Do